MTTRVAVSLPTILFKEIDKERKRINLNRSAFFKEALELFLGKNSLVDEKFVKKYGPIFKKVEEEERQLNEEVFKAASEVILKK